MIFRSSHLINGILTNSEAWYGLTKANVEPLEQVDEMLLRRVLEVGSCCPKEMLYLETGATPIRFTIKQRRLMFLHYILNEGEKNLISKCFKAQKEILVEMTGLSQSMMILKNLILDFPLKIFRIFPNISFRIFSEKLLKRKL